MNDIVVSDYRPMKIAEVKDHIHTIQQVMREVMQPNVHYGIIPGCDKPSLWKPGAEKLLSTFRIAAEPTVEDLSTPDEARFRVRCSGIHVSGANLGSCCGECSSGEEKYKWRSAVCDDEFDATPETHRRIKYKRGKGGSSYTVKQIRTEPADMRNTVLKMAIKRAQVGMCLNVTAASDIFTQDLEDGDVVEAEHAPTIQAPQSKQAEPSDSKFISEPQRRRLFAIAKGAGKADEAVKQYLQDKWKVSSSKDITLDMYDEVCEWAESKAN